MQCKIHKLRSRISRVSLCILLDTGWCNDFIKNARKSIVLLAHEPLFCSLEDRVANHNTLFSKGTSDSSTVRFVERPVINRCVEKRRAFMSGRKEEAKMIWFYVYAIVIVVTQLATLDSQAKVTRQYRMTCNILSFDIANSLEHSVLCSCKGCIYVKTTQWKWRRLRLQTTAVSKLSPISKIDMKNLIQIN